MAKKTKMKGKASFSDLNNFLNTIAPDGEIIDDNPIAKIDEWISTGSYILNAALSGSIFGGMPNRRSLGLAGLEGSGKTFLALSIVRNAINHHGYSCIYMDSEGSIDQAFVQKLGVDTSKVRLQPVNTIEEVNHIVAQLIDQFQKNKEAGLESPKVILVLDSLGNLTSAKEATDSVDGNNKRDMTKQQAIRKLFRVNGMKLAKHAIPFVVTAHLYDKIGSFFPGHEVSGGGGLKYNVSVMFQLSKKKLEDKESEEMMKKKGINAPKMGVTIKVTPIKQRFAKPIITEMHIPFYKAPNPFVGLETYMNWKSCGIMRGKALLEKDYLKLTDVEKAKCQTFATEIERKLKPSEVLSPADKKKVIEKDGDRFLPEVIAMYALPKDTARTLVCEHLGGELPLGELFTEKVFTQDVLHKLDDNIIKPTFQLPSIESLEDLAELTATVEIGEDIEKEDE